MRKIPRVKKDYGEREGGGKWRGIIVPVFLVTLGKFL